MSDSESNHLPAPHPSLGGKSLQALERPRYKSWRKKYRKMRLDFDSKFEDNKRLFKEEHKLEAIAKRLREELDGLLEICLDLNQNPSIPPELRFDVSIPNRQGSSQLIVPANITPEDANDLLMQYKQAVHEAHIPPLDLHVVRAQIEQRLAEQDVRKLQDLESTTPQPIPAISELPEDITRDDAPGYLTCEQETDYLQRLDAKTGDPLSVALRTSESKLGDEDKQVADPMSRDFERQSELINPQSQHNWLRTHTKMNVIVGDVDDNESLASHDLGKPPPKRRGATKNLAKQVGDRAVERAREGFSPGAASGFEEDELSVMDDHPVPSRKRARESDSTYRTKTGKSGGGGGGAGGPKAKRKRGGEEVGGPGSASKKAKTEGTLD